MTKDQIFAQDLRRVLYFQQLLKFSLEALSESSLLPSHCKLRDNVRNQLNSIKVFKRDILTVPGNRALVEAELTSERIIDINLIFEKINNIENIDEVYMWLSDMTETAQVQKLF